MDPELELELAIAAAKAKKAKAAAPTYADATQSEYLRKQLEGLAASGKIRPEEQAQLDALQATAPQAQEEIGSTGALYRGFGKQMMFNARDELAGATSALTGGSYDEGLNASRAKDDAAAAAYPDQFSKGEIAGGFTSAALPGLGWAKATQGMGIAGKAATGGGIGAIVEGLRGFMDGRDGAENRLDAAAIPAAIGAGFGVAAPLVAKGSGAIVRALMGRAPATQGVSARAVNKLLPAYEQTRLPEGDVRAYLDSLGAEGMLADVPGPLQQKAQGLASMGGSGGAKLGMAVDQRATGAGPRIQQVMDDQIAAPNAAFDYKRMLATERTNSLGPEYEAALNSGAQFDPAAIAGSLPQDSVGAVRGASNSVARDLGLPRNPNSPGAFPAKPVPATKLHAIRSALSDELSAAGREGRGGFVAGMKPTLGAIDSQLDQIPGYADARTGYANNKAMDRAIEDGQEALRGGRATASSPAEFKVQFDKLSDAQKDGFRAGIRRDVAALMGTSRNDAAAAWGEFSKEWNAEKLRIALGADAEPIIRRLESEKVFSQTRGKVSGGSETAARTAAQKDLSAADPSGDLAGAGLGAPIRALTKYVADPLLFGPRRSALNEGIGSALSMQGDDAKLLAEFMQEQLKRRANMKSPAVVQALMDTLTRGAGGAYSSTIAP